MDIFYIFGIELLDRFIFFATIFYFDSELISAIGTGLLFGIVVFFGVTVPIRFSERSRNRIIKPKEKIKWSLNNYLKEYKEFDDGFEKVGETYDFRKWTSTWTKLWKLMRKLYIKFMYVISLIICIIIFLLSLLFSLIFFPEPLYLGFLFISLIYFLSILDSGLSVEEIGNKTYPNQGIWESIKNCVKYILVVNLFFVSIFIISYFYGFLDSDAYTLLMDSGAYTLLSLYLYFVNIYVFIIGGGMAIMRHYCLRLGLYLNNKIPWNYVKFLDSCADRILLQKVGGGYIFVHRMLMEYFADLENKPLPEEG